MTAFKDQVPGENILKKNSDIMQKPEVLDFSSGGGLLFYIMPHKMKIVF